jgi:hypothetical protein
LSQPPPSLQVQTRTPPPEGGQEHTNPLHLQETAAAASAETNPIDFQDMAIEQATCP